MSEAAKLMAEALALPARERLRMARELLRSVDEDDEEADDEEAVAAAWAAEIERRADAVHAGEVTLVDSAEVFERLRDEFRERR